MPFELRFDPEKQKERSRKAALQHPATLRVQRKLPEIHRLLRDTLLSSREIAGMTGVSNTTVARIAKDISVDLGERNKTKRGKPKPTGASAVNRTVVHESMSQDGSSLKWLSMQW